MSRSRQGPAGDPHGRGDDHRTTSVGHRHAPCERKADLGIAFGLAQRLQLCKSPPPSWRRPTGPSPGATSSGRRSSSKTRGGRGPDQGHEPRRLRHRSGDHPRTGACPGPRRPRATIGGGHRRGDRRQRRPQDDQADRQDAIDPRRRGTMPQDPRKKARSPLIRPSSRSRRASSPRWTRSRTTARRATRGRASSTGKAAVITGGDSGIGRAVALAFAREGADVLISYLSEEADAKETARVVEAAGRKCVAVAGRHQRGGPLPGDHRPGGEGVRQGRHPGQQRRLPDDPRVHRGDLAPRSSTGR